MKSFFAVIALALTIAAANGSAYAPAGMKGPPCPKSVVVSCAPLVQSVPCKGGASAGYQGAYSEYAPQYAAPVVDEVAGAEELAASASEYAPRYAAPSYQKFYKYY